VVAVDALKALGLCGDNVYTGCAAACAARSATALTGTIQTDTSNGEFIVSYEFAERDLVHIRNVLGYLERSAGYVCQTDAGAVVSLDHWRARVRAILVMPLPPVHIEKQAKDLLGRLDHLEGHHHRGTSGDARSLSSAL
jgi:hypothetical protein